MVKYPVLRTVVVCLEYLALAVCAAAVGTLFALWATLVIVNVLIKMVGQ